MLTTLDLLQNATELPELFMKTNEEIAVWRLLRRVSDRVKLRLDTDRMDDATRVTNFE